MGSLLNEYQHRELGLNWNPLPDAPALYHATYVGTEVYKADAASRANARRFRGEPMTTVTETFRYKPVYAHPGIEQAISARFSKPWDHPLIGALENLSAFSKKNVLGLSVFHPVSITEVSHATQLMGQGVSKVELHDWMTKPTWPAPKVSRTGRVKEAVKNTYFLDSEYWRGMRSSVREVMGKQPRERDAPPLMRHPEAIVRDAIEHTLSLDSEERHSSVIKTLQGFGKNSQSRAWKTATSPVRGYGNIQYVLDRSLWDFYDKGQKLNAYYTIAASELAKAGPEISAAEVSKIKRGSAEFVNNIYGGVSFERLLIHPVTRQFLQIGMLAPAWKISQLRVVSQGFEGVSQKRLADRYVIQSAIAWFLSAQMLNYATTAYHNSQDKNGNKGAHFTWDNVGNPLVVGGKDLGVTTNFANIYDGVDRNGREKYMALNKALRDTMASFIAPREVLVSSMHPMLKSGMQLLFDRDPATGYKLVDEKDSALEKTAKRMDIALQAWLPISVTSGVRAIEHKMFPEAIAMPASMPNLSGLPSRVGMTYEKTVESYTEAMKEGDRDRAARILKMAAINNLNPGSIHRAYISYLRTRQKRALGPQGGAK